MAPVATTDVLQVGTIAMGLFGGLALFLFGMEQMTDALKIVAGSGMKSVLAKLTTNRFKALFAGAFVTAVIQSSSVTTVLVVGFISAGLMSLSQSIGVILGADIGTTVTAQIVAFKVTQYALWLVAVGFLLLFAVKDDRTRHYGHIIMGLGLIFFGMQLMSEAARPLRTYEPFRALMAQMSGPLAGILIGALFTAVIQSSSAAIGVVIALASQGLITLEAGIALAFGANIGTCVTALLAGIGKPRDAVRAAVVHILFKVIGVLIWLGLIAQLAALVRWMSPSAPELDGAARLAAETPRQIANAHTVFNVVNAMLFIGLANPIAALVRWLIPDRPAREPEVIRPRYLDEIMLQTPALALDIVRMELGRLGASAMDMVRGAPRCVMEGTREELDALRRKDNEVDTLHGAVITYLGRLSQENLSNEQSERLHDYMAAANYLENIGDMIETNLHDAGVERLRQGLEMSDATKDVLSGLHRRVEWAVERAITGLVGADREAALEVVAAKDDINRLANAAESHLAGRLTAAEPNRLAAFRVETDIIENLKRIYYFAKRVAKVVIEQDVGADRPAPAQKTDEVETA
jgi:phosphate:Na+ symporter